eukprot:3802677-Rhodomonas_salina.2
MQRSLLFYMTNSYSLPPCHALNDWLRTLRSISCVHAHAVAAQHLVLFGRYFVRSEGFLHLRALAALSCAVLLELRTNTVGIVGVPS